MKSDRHAEAPRLHFTALTGVFAILSILLVGTLAVAPARGYFTEWRRVQRRYNALAARSRSAPISVGIKQIWVPDLQVVDRCPTCHLAVEYAGTLPSDRLFGAHPDIPHDPRRMGCTPCHGGVGRATSSREAHGLGHFTSEPLLEQPHVEAGCGTCHSHLSTPRRAAAEQGRRIFDEVRCHDCHTGTRDLGSVALRGIRADWYDTHMGRSSGGISFTPLADEEVPAVTAYLMTLAGAPRLVAAKMLATEFGCRGCHRIHRVGGDVGPDLADEGRRSLDGLDFSAVRGTHTLPNWLHAHFLDPPRLSPGSGMPRLGMSEPEADLLTTFVLSLRDWSVPLEFAPPDRVRGLILGERDFPTDGESLFGVFCVGCHGRHAEGSQVPALRSRVPPIGNADFLAIADDRFLRETISNGRPGRLMPAWGSLDTGLRPTEILALARYLRSLMPVAPAFEAVMTEPVDMALGASLFSANCAGCHGTQGEGSVVAPPLGATDNLTTRADNPIYGTLAAGVSGTAMGSFRRFDARSLRALIATVRTLPAAPTTRTGWARHPGDLSRGEPLFATHCSECHGRRGEGDRAPALRNPAFLGAASNDYITASIVRGFAGTDMPRFGTGDERHARLTQGQVADIVAFVRSWAPAVRGPVQAAAGAPRSAR